MSARHSSKSTSVWGSQTDLNILCSLPFTLSDKQDRFSKYLKSNNNLCLKGHSRSLFFFCPFYIWSSLWIIVSYKNCRWQASNSGLLASEATALPMMPQPMPIWTVIAIMFINKRPVVASKVFEDLAALTT